MPVRNWDCLIKIITRVKHDIIVREWLLIFLCLLSEVLNWYFLLVVVFLYTLHSLFSSISISGFSFPAQFSTPKHDAWYFCLYRFSAVTAPMQSNTELSMSFGRSLRNWKLARQTICRDGQPVNLRQYLSGMYLGIFTLYTILERPYI